MSATHFWKSNYPDIVGVQVDEDGSIIEKVDLGILLEAYHQRQMEIIIDNLHQYNALASTDYYKMSEIIEYLK